MSGINFRTGNAHSGVDSAEAVLSANACTLTADEDKSRIGVRSTTGQTRSLEAFNHLAATNLKKIFLIPTC